jgi:hypothetical protein
MLAARPPSCARRLWIAGILALSWAVPRAASPQIAPRILHEGLGCILAGQHAVIEALVEPTDDLVTVKVYFRAEIYPAFFFVEAVRSADRYRAVLPRPTRDVPSVVYYLEAVDSGFNSFRTEEFRPPVVLDAADCDEDGATPVYADGPAAITVGATTAGPSFPPGFLTEGIVGTITAVGRTTGGSAATIVGVGAAAGAAVGVGILVGGGDDEASVTTAPVVSGVTTTIAATTSSSPTSSVPPSTESVVACFDTIPNPPTIPVRETVRFDATCSRPARDQIASYEWVFNDGREGKEGRVVTRQYTSPGVFPAELFVTDIRGVRARVEKEVRVNEATGGPGGPAGPGGPTTTVPGNADLQVTGLSFSPPSSVGAGEVYSVDFRNAGPDSDPTVTLVVAFNAAGSGGAPGPISTSGCGTSSGAGSLTVSCFIGAIASGAAGSRSITVQFPSIDTYSVTATVFGGTSDPVPGNDSRTVNTVVTLKAGDGLTTSFLSEIQSGSSSPVQASIELNGLGTSPVSGRGPSRHAVKPQPGENVLAGYAAAAHLDGALWKIDFSQTEGFVPGSLDVESGDVISASAHSVAFRLTGSESRIRLRFRIEH